MIIGLTGGIASGKTTVSNILQKLGVEIIDADLIAHQVLNKGEEGWKRVVEHFGRDILNDRGEISRKVLGGIVFNHSERLKKLEELIHPLIIEEIKNRIKSFPEGMNVVLDALLLYETGLESLVDEVWVVFVDRETQYKRLQERDGFSRSEARVRVDAQLSLEKKKEIADVVIDNRDDINQLRIKIYNLWRKRNEENSSDCT